MIRLSLNKAFDTLTYLTLIDFGFPAGIAGVFQVEYVNGLNLIP